LDERLILLAPFAYQLAKEGLGIVIDQGAGVFGAGQVRLLSQGHGACRGSTILSCCFGISVQRHGRLVLRGHTQRYFNPIANSHSVTSCFPGFRDKLRHILISMDHRGDNVFIEPFFNKIKHCRCVASRDDKLAAWVRDYFYATVEPNVQCSNQPAEACNFFSRRTLNEGRDG
jgi:hypothetical protein